MPGEPVQIEPGKTAFFWLDGEDSISITHEGHSLFISVHGKASGIWIRPISNETCRVGRFGSLEKDSD